jgi:DNA (cytosine-5)-methyltransferase 1
VSHAYYNELDPFAAQWLRNLIDADLIAPGDVDERSIVDVRPADLAGFTQCHFFAGVGGWSYALGLAGWPDERPVWTGSCPCQPFSLAGKRKGFSDDRHLWPVWRELIRECAPSVVFGEQVASATDWLGLVRSDLEAMGFAVGAIPVEAASAGADHLRDRYWFVADSESKQVGSAGQPRQCGHVCGMANAHNPRPQGRPTEFERADQWAARQDGLDMAHSSGDGAGRGSAGGAGQEDAPISVYGRLARSSAAPRLNGEIEWVIGADGKARRVKSGIRLLAHGVPARVSKLRAFGNAIDPRPAAEFIGAYMDIAP